MTIDVNTNDDDFVIVDDEEEAKLLAEFGYLINPEDLKDFQKIFEFFKSLNLTEINTSYDLISTIETKFSNISLTKEDKALFGEMFNQFKANAQWITDTKAYLQWVTTSSLMLAGLYWGGPIASKIARAAFDTGYVWEFGRIPHILNPMYALVYFPLKEHFSNVAYTYGPAVLATAGAILPTAVLKTAEGSQYLVQKATKAMAYMYQMTTGSTAKITENTQNLHMPTVDNKEILKP